jgi:hypothetical protein
MKRSAGAAFAAFFLVTAAAHAASRPTVAPATTADALFEQGEFEQAKEAYQAVPKSSPQYPAALRQLGTIALYQNHLGEAELLLTNARSLDPADLRTAGLLAETMNREGHFTEMVQLLKQIGRPERAAEFQMFGKAAPYRIAAHQGTVTVDFQWTDPLPVVEAKVNGFTGLFIIDTGAPEIILDPDFALYAHVQTTAGQTKGAPAGERTASIKFGRISQFALARLETDDVPAMLLSTRGFGAVARKKRIAGVIGTEFLSHFRPTLDYVHDRLILEPHDAPPSQGASIAEAPFWFVGDHFLLAQGRLANGPKQLFFADTGVPGTAFTAPESTLRDAGIPVPTPQAPAGNAIGQAPAAKFPVAKLSLGTLTQTNLTGLYGPFPPGLEKGLGVRIGGIVSHDFFHPYAVTFDFVRMTMDFRK